MNKTIQSNTRRLQIYYALLTQSTIKQGKHSEASVQYRANRVLVR